MAKAPLFGISWYFKVATSDPRCYEEILSPGMAYGLYCLKSSLQVAGVCIDVAIGCPSKPV